MMALSAYAKHGEVTFQAEGYLFKMQGFPLR